MSDRDHQQDLKAYIEHWRRVGPKLEAIRREELRRFDFQANQSQVAALFELGVKHGQPRTSSGLVELQRRLREIFG